VKAQRLRTAREFQRVYAEGRRRAGALLVAYRRESTGPARVGVVVGGRVGRAVVRNRVRRRIREALRQLPLASGQELVVVARRAAARAGFWELRGEVEDLLRALGAVTEAEG
jgi:ribonuclease P protein component